MKEPGEITRLLREKALAEGFDLFGVARSEPLSDHAEVLKKWCNDGMNAEMGFISRNIEKRIDPGLLFPGARSVIVTGLNYYTGRKQADSAPVIARYAYGKDYHDVIPAKLDDVIEYLKIICPGAEAKAFVDSETMLEKAWARRAGLGWPGRHSVLVNRKIGSFFFIGIIITDIELAYSKPHVEDYCGSCRLCLEACPVNAINDNRTINAGRCIAYRTIESKQPVDEHTAEKFNGRAYGCDICQEVCPWNNNAPESHTPEFQPLEGLLEMTAGDWKNLTEKQFKTMFSHSAISRRKYSIFIQNVTNVTKFVKI